MDDADARALVARTEAALARLESLPAEAAATATEALSALVTLYGEALSRVAAVFGTDVLATDEVVRHLLVLHEIIPAEAVDDDTSFIPVDSVSVRRRSPAR
ncbi:MAG: hypothetical protein JO148_01945 [Acidimicrobiia bacterium]|nr:hypothetical protein [Acidimicrobiia bacterium]